MRGLWYWLRCCAAHLRRNRNNTGGYVASDSGTTQPVSLFVRMTDPRYMPNNEARDYENRPAVPTMRECPRCMGSGVSLYGNLGGQCVRCGGIGRVPATVQRSQVPDQPVVHHGGGVAAPPPEPNPWQRDQFNVTRQIEIFQRDPALASRLRQAAGYGPYTTTLDKPPPASDNVQQPEPPPRKRRKLRF